MMFSIFQLRMKITTDFTAGRFAGSESVNEMLYDIAVWLWLRIFSALWWSYGRVNSIFYSLWEQRLNQYNWFYSRSCDDEHQVQSVCQRVLGAFIYLLDSKLC